jgi:hypothetical protein
MLHPIIYYVVLIVLCACSSNAVAQELRPTVYYMKSQQVSQIAKDIHSGKVIASADNPLVFTVADSMASENNNTRAFYIFLVSKMLQYSEDEKLKVLLGNHCKQIMQNKPDPVVGLLFSTTVKPEYRTAWAEAIALAIDVNCEEVLLECFKATRLLSLEVTSPGNKAKVEAIFNMVRSELKLQRH